MTNPYVRVYIGRDYRASIFLQKKISDIISDAKELRGAKSTKADDFAKSSLLTVPYTDMLQLEAFPDDQLKQLNALLSSYRI